jgi:hypothetical protein
MKQKQKHTRIRIMTGVMSLVCILTMIGIQVDGVFPDDIFKFIFVIFVLSALAIGSLIFTISPSRGWFGLRVVTFAVFTLLLANLIFWTLIPWFKGEPRNTTVLNVGMTILLLPASFSFTFFGKERFIDIIKKNGENKENWQR